MKVVILGSGSKGNSTYINLGKDHILIDAGFNYLTLKKRLEEQTLNIKLITKVFITHEHSDHIKGLASLVKKTNCLVYGPNIIISNLTKIINPNNLRIIDQYQNFNSYEVETVPTSHDAEQSVGYIFKEDNNELVYITDTGYINQKILKKITNKSMYILESNYDEKMLWDGPYPYYLKQRITSDTGHLSNLMTAEYLSKIVGNKTKYIVLAHISENNNNPDLAFIESNNELTKLDYKNIMLHVTKQETSSQIYLIGDSND